MRKEREHTSMIVKLNEETNRLLKMWAIKHGRLSKAEAAEKVIELWLIEKGYLESPEKEPI